MTAQSRFRIAAAVGALVAPLALVAATSAPADAGTSKHKHEVYMYKVEKNIRLAGVGSDGFGDSPSQTVRCEAGDSALDGMWSVKHVDQYQAPIPDDPDEDTDFPSVPTLHGQYDDERDVWVQASYGDPVDMRAWHFVLKNKAWGDAQVKLFLTCIRGYTENSRSHHHQIKVRNLMDWTVSTTLSADWGPTRFVYNASGGGGNCGSTEYFVAPGFDLGAPNYRLVASYPFNAGKSWVWEFGKDNVGPGPAIQVYGRCIDRKVYDGAIARHALAMKHLPSVNFALGFEALISQDDHAQEERFSCDQDNPSYHAYKAMVGWFWMGDHWDDNWYLGMEPRPKTRAYSFWNHHALPAQVKYGALCINSRTSYPLP